MIDILTISFVAVVFAIMLATILWRDHRANVREAQLQLDLDTLSAERDQLARDKNKCVEAVRGFIDVPDDIISYRERTQRAIAVLAEIDARSQNDKGKSHEDT